MKDFKIWPYVKISRRIFLPLVTKAFPIIKPKFQTQIQFFFSARIFRKKLRSLSICEEVLPMKSDFLRFWRTRKLEKKSIWRLVDLFLGAIEGGKRLFENEASGARDLVRPSIAQPAKERPLNKPRLHQPVRNVDRLSEKGRIQNYP